MARSVVSGTTILGNAAEILSPPFTFGMLVQNISGAGGDIAITGSSWRLLWQLSGSGLVTLSLPLEADYPSDLPSPTGATWRWMGISVLDSTHVRLWVGSTSDDITIVGPWPPATGGFWLGNDSNGIDGNIAEAAIWDVALDAEDTAALDALKFPNCVAPTQLKHWWALNNAGGFPEPDDAGSDDLTLNSGTAPLVTHPTMVACSSAKRFLLTRP